MPRKRKLMIRDYYGPRGQFMQADWTERTVYLEIPDGTPPLLVNCESNQEVWDCVRNQKEEWAIMAAIDQKERREAEKINPPETIEFSYRGLRS